MITTVIIILIINGNNNNNKDNIRRQVNDKLCSWSQQNCPLLVLVVILKVQEYASRFLHFVDDEYEGTEGYDEGAVNVVLGMREREPLQQGVQVERQLIRREVDHRGTQDCGVIVEPC